MSRRAFAEPRRRLRAVVIAAALGAACGFAWTALELYGRWPAIDTLRHIAAFPDCHAARLVGLAPARRGEPGYWPSHDADRDGIACENSRRHAF